MSLQASAPFSISMRAGFGAVVIDVDGEFDIDELDAFRACVNAVIDACADPVIVDLADVTFIDSAAITALWWARRCLAREDRELCLHHVSAPVSRVLELTGVTDFFVVDSSVVGSA